MSLDANIPLPSYGAVSQLSNGLHLPRNLPSNDPQSMYSLPGASATNFASSSSPNKPSFRAPAHKHAHHLHSIPPREKSTRTLIIDHMLWVHAPNYAHRRRPENYEEEDEEGSEGEDAAKLKTRAGGDTNDDEEEDRLRTQDLILARSLRLRAEGLEKVVTSMLEQPPPIHSINDQDILTPPHPQSSIPPTSLIHCTPHLAERRALTACLGHYDQRPFRTSSPTPSVSPYPPFRHKDCNPDGGSSSSHQDTSTSSIPLALAKISTISASRSRVFQTSSNPPEQPRLQLEQAQAPSSRTRSLYMAGADPSTANSPPAFRCPRHLHTGCEICVEAKSTTRTGVGGVRGRSTSVAGDFGVRAGATGGANAAAKAGIAGWQDGSGVGSGLLRPGVKGSVLRRKVNEDGADDLPAVSAGAGNTKLSELVPRFIRLSALVAAELGREAREDDGESYSDGSKQGSHDGEAGEYTRQEDGGAMFSPLPAPASPYTVDAIQQAQDRIYGYALRPSREWYLLLAGLLTRAVLEGYLTAGWRGPQAVKCLLTVGLGIVDGQGKDGEEEDTEDEYAEFDPDELSNLRVAAKILFPSLRNTAPSMRRDEGEEEYEAEMLERLRRFYDIPASTPDLSTHMEDLAWQYPAEPVERAAVRFCEAIARWRGKPELETGSTKRNHPHLKLLPQRWRWNLLYTQTPQALLQASTRLAP
ncbi:hypothetical protein BD779DRAFT_1466102 [Infundibulicybe gibba]|nr:hypothetical protein BD779DRAFT_1466102 [Infundibulicybe gibba]